MVDPVTPPSLPAARGDMAMREILRQIFTGWILHEKSWDAESREYKREMTACMIEAAGGDYVRGQLLHLFGEWSNDVQALAPHYGLNLERCFAGELYINEDIPPAPDPDFWWFNGQWHLPDLGDDGLPASELCSIAVAGCNDESKRP